MLGSLKLIKSIHRIHSAARVVLASSGGTVYVIPSQIPATDDHPLRSISPYGVSKRAVESYLDVLCNEIGYPPYTCAWETSTGRVSDSDKCLEPRINLLLQVNQFAS
jgi:nucleoside-diphosphate-sugar epimerase